MTVAMIACLGVLAVSVPEALAHGGLAKPIPRIAMGKKYEPFSIGEHQPVTNPYGKSHLTAKLSSPCMGSPIDGEIYSPNVYHDHEKVAKPAEANYAAGGTLEAEVLLNADHNGLASWSYCPHSMEQTEKCFRDREIYSQNHGRESAIWVDVHSYWGIDGNYGDHGKSGHSFPQEVYLPSDMPTGRTTIRWLWICKYTDEIFVSCFDTEITAGGSSPNPLPRPYPKPYPKPSPSPAPSDYGSKCVWTDPPNVEVTFSDRERKVGRVCWDYTVAPGTKVYIRSHTDIYTSWNAEVCCVSSSPTYGSAEHGQSNVVVFTPKWGSFGFCECTAWDPTSPGASCAGQATAANMKCPVNGAIHGMCRDGEKGSEFDNLPISCTDPFAPEPELEPEPEPEAEPEAEPEPSPGTAQCSEADTDVYNPWLGGCCVGLHQVEEDRPTSDPFFCASSSSNHGKSCWSNILKCREEAPERPRPKPVPKHRPRPQPRPLSPSSTPLPSSDSATTSCAAHCQVGNAGVSWVNKCSWSNCAGCVECVAIFKSCNNTLWAKCGGQGWTGASCCQTGSVCKFHNDYYSQCVPDSSLLARRGLKIQRHRPEDNVLFQYGTKFSEGFEEL